MFTKICGITHEGLFKKTNTHIGLAKPGFQALILRTEKQSSYYQLCCSHSYGITGCYFTYTLIRDFQLFPSLDSKELVMQNDNARVLSIMQFLEELFLHFNLEA